MKKYLSLMAIGLFVGSYMYAAGILVGKYGNTQLVVLSGICSLLTIFAVGKVVGRLDLW